ncbi:uncharacterized protein LOC123316974 [Coccinella septempunctata]|uniref:uncharacterized protein LOC123316974 n=1 Tax=Coccinella septempunctata TaxID=41139 RepID=UPI001D08AA68|nr:uncharacterized protein LOC123316974 [Coccinella septempunctata]
MRVRCYVIFFFILSLDCDAKSVGCGDGTKGCERPFEKTDTVVKKKNRLEELKENVGKVGNKLEGIVYEVLKDILKDDLDSSEERRNVTNDLVKEKEIVNNSSVKKDELIHSDRLRKHFEAEETTISNEIETKTTQANPAVYNYQLLASNVPTAESDPLLTTVKTNETVDTTEASPAPTTTQKSRQKRMIHENGEQQSRSVESFIESNQDKNFQGDQLLEDPTDTSMPVNPIRLRSKDDNVRRDPKKEPTEDNKSKRPQDEVSMRHLPMPDNPPTEAIGTPIKKQSPNRGTVENNTIDTPKRRKSSPDLQRSTRRKTINDDQPDFQYQSHQEKKKVYDKGNAVSRNNLEEMNLRQTNPQVSLEDLSDFQLPTKKIAQKNTQRSNPEPKFQTHLETKKIFSPAKAGEQATDNPTELGDARLGQSYMWGNQPSNCYEKNNRDDLLEKQHIEDLKYEVTKLRNVVDLLKEQQKLINSFDGDKKTMNTQEMMTVLNQLNNNNDKPVALDKTQQYSVDTTTKAKHEELGQIKVQLKEAIDNLNRTKEILNLEHRKEMTLETELKSQKTEINWLKLIIENFIIAQAKKKIKDEPNDTKIIEPEVKTMNDTNLVGAKNPTVSLKKTHNRTIPSTVQMAQEKLMEMEQMHSRESSTNDENDRGFKRQMDDIKVSSPKGRASSMSNLEKLLDNLSDKQSKTIDDDDNFQNRIFDAIKQLRKKKEEESFTKDLIRKLQLNTVESKSEDDMLVKFQKALKALDNPQGKSDDLDIEDQLKVLQKEINKLKSTDVNLFTGELKSPEEDNAQLQLMLTKLIANNPQLQGMKLPPITPQQLIQLQKKFGKRPGIVPTGMGNIAVGGDFGVTPPASIINAFPAGMGKVGPLYGPFAPNLSPYGSNAYGKDLDGTSSLGPYSTAYGQDLTKMLYGSSPSNLYPSNNDFAGNMGYFGNNGYLGGGTYSSGSVSGSAYSTHGSNYPSPSLGVYGASKTPYGGGVMNGYGNMYSPYKPAYGKLQDGYSSMNTYGSQPLTYSNPAYGPKVDQYGNDKQGYGNNNFFQITQPSTYGSGPPAPYLPPKAIDAAGPEKIYGNQPSYAAGGAPYASDKIEELKTQIYALQNAISTYNRPEYTPTAEDKNTIRNLEQQIEELKGIVNSLNGYSGEQQNYGQQATSQYEPTPYGSPNEPKNIESYNRESEKRIKRSIQDETAPNQLNSTASKHDENRKEVGFLDRLVSLFEKTFSDGVHRSNNETRRRRSVEDNSVDDGSSSNVMDKLTTVLREVLDEEPETQPKQLFGTGPMQINTMNSLSRSADNQQANSIPQQTSLQDIKKQIDHLKKQLGTSKSANKSPANARSADPSNQSQHPTARHAILPDPSYGFNYALSQFPTDLSVKPKKLDIFKEIVAKVMDKVIESLPVILQKLFGFAVHELTAYGDEYGATYGSDSSYLSVFRNLGIFGYLPLILLRVVNAVSTFIYILQKNKFLKYFLVPAGVVLLVTGGMVFLIWWMQPGDFYINYDKVSYDKETPYGVDYSSGDYGKSNGQIVKTYGVEDGKSRLHTYNHAGDSKSLQPNGYPSFYKPNLVITSDNQMPVYNE